LKVDLNYEKVSKYVLVGSSKFSEEALELKHFLEKQGHEVVGIPTHVPHENNHVTPENLQRKSVVYKDFHGAIDKADVVLICNWDDRLGFNSMMDIGYAIKAGKMLELLLPTKIPELLMLGIKPLQIEDAPWVLTNEEKSHFGEK